MTIDNLNAVRAAMADLPAPDANARAAAAERNAVLTKPPGALGRLEDLAIWYAGWRGDPRPRIQAPQVIVFAANHGVAARGVSAFPAEVTAQMVANFEAGGAAINQLAAAAGARLDVLALSLDVPTADFTEGPAMNEQEVTEALQTGINALAPDTDLLVVGEMGIGNTTSAAAIACSLFGGTADDWTGAGTGVAGDALDAKKAVVTDGVARHGSAGDGLEILRRLGGREVAAMAGAIVAARQARVPVILDGYIACAAAACLEQTRAGALDHVVAAHRGAEAAHGRLLDALGKVPLLDLGMRLGEGSGGALAIPLLRGALACHSGMATFAEAGVSEG